MSASPVRSWSGGLTRRSLLGQSLGALAGIVLAGCGGTNESRATVSPASEAAVDGVNGLSGVRVEVWRDPG